MSALSLTTSQAKHCKMTRSINSNRWTRGIKGSRRVCLRKNLACESMSKTLVLKILLALVLYRVCRTTCLCRWLKKRKRKNLANRHSNLLIAMSNQPRSKVSSSMAGYNQTIAYHHVSVLPLTSLPISTTEPVLTPSMLEAPTIRFYCLATPIRGQMRSMSKLRSSMMLWERRTRMIRKNSRWWRTFWGAAIRPWRSRSRLLPGRVGGIRTIWARKFSSQRTKNLFWPFSTRSWSSATLTSVLS